MQHPLPALADPLFRSQIAPDAAFPHPAWQQARAAALAGLDGGGITVLMGPPGSGKSLLLKDLARMLRQAGRPARLVEPTDAVAGTAGDGILLVDEADTLSPDALAALCAAPAPVLLAALPGFSARLSGQGRRAHQVVLNRLQPQDVARYVAARLDATGRPRGLLEPEAVLALARHSDGLLRLVNTLGAAAVFLAGLDGSLQVGPHHVEEAASMRDDEALERPSSAAPAGVAPALPGPVAPAVSGTAASGPAAPAALPADPASDLPSPVQPLAALTPPNYQAEVLRRRAALGTMVAASGLLFALPWLTRRQPDAQTSPAQAAGDSPVAVVQADAVQAHAGSAELDDAPAATADSGAVAPAPPALPPDAPTQGSAAAAPAHAAPSRRPGRAPAAAIGNDGATMASNAPVLFQGPIFNETMGQGGHVTLVIRRQAPTGAITARFDASQGLSGAGMLAGSLSGNGQITASGQLLMGRNPFMCDLSGTLDGDTLTGSASFSRTGNSRVYRSRFSLVRA